MYYNERFSSFSFSVEICIFRLLTYFFHDIFFLVSKRIYPFSSLIPMLQIRNCQKSEKYKLQFP